MTAVVVPFAGECEYRRRALDWVRSSYIAAGFEVVVGEGDPSQWSKAEAVADGLASTAADLLVIADADVWAEDLTATVAAVAAGARWGMPHRQVWRLSKACTARWLTGDRERVETVETHRPMVGGGIVVIRREVYETCPLDPRFVGWGGEDQAWGLALQTLHGDPYRGTERLWHFWHPPQARRKPGRVAATAASVENVHLLTRYAEAIDRPEQMRTVMEGSWQSKTSSPPR